MDSKLGSQVKRTIYAADIHEFFVQGESILRTFRKNLLKKFDREKTRGVAFETDDLTSQGLRQTKATHLKEELKLLRKWEQGELIFLKGKDRPSVHRRTAGCGVFFSQTTKPRGQDANTK